MKNLKLEVFETNKAIYIVVCITIAAFFFALNTATPFYADDNSSFSTIWGTQTRIQSLTDAAQTAWGMYNERYGRIIPAFVICVFRFLPKIIFNVANTLIYLLLVNLMVYHSAERKNSFLLIFVNLGLWFMLQGFGSTVIWLSASVEYMWTRAIGLLFLIPYKKTLLSEKTQSGRRNLLKAVAMFVFGTFSCSLNEIVGATICFFVFLLLMSDILRFKRKISLGTLWQFSGLAGAISGCAFVTFAPGNFSRLSMVPQPRGFFIEIIYRLARETLYPLLSFLPVVLALVVLHIAYKNALLNLSFREYAFRTYHSTVYLLGSVAAVYLLTFASGYSKRTLIVPAIFLLIAVGALYSKIERVFVIQKLVFSCLAIVALLAFTQYSVGMFLLREPDTFLDIRTDFVHSSNSLPPELFPDY